MEDLVEYMHCLSPFSCQPDIQVPVLLHFGRRKDFILQRLFTKWTRSGPLSRTAPRVLSPSIIPFIVSFPFPVSLSHFPTERGAFPEINSQISYLHSHLCLRVCFYGNSANTSTLPYEGKYLFADF